MQNTTPVTSNDDFELRALGIIPMEGPTHYTREYSSLYLCSLTPEQHERTCNYWYTVTDSATAHTAFTTREGLLQWLDERGLQLTEELPEQGTWSGQRIAGKYRTALHVRYAEFYALEGRRTRQVSNGDYTLAIITTDADGVRTEHTLNCNCRSRPIFNYRESNELMK